MAKVTEITERLVKEEKEIMNIYLKAMNFGDLMEIDIEGFEAMKSMYKLLNTTNELMVAYAEVIESMNAKIDSLVSEKNKQA